VKITLEEAEKFFSHVFGGRHHIPSKIKTGLFGFYVLADLYDLATYDRNILTRIVILAHDYSYRVQFASGNLKSCKIIISKRQNEYTDIDLFHPTIEQSIKLVREHDQKQNYGELYGPNYKPT
jgi:hypothetical protein